MKTDVSKINEKQFVSSRSLIRSSRFRINAVKSMRRILYLLIFTGIAAVFNSCGVGWVETEPSYGIEIERPARPGEAFIWIDGGWRWDRDSHAYIREPGYWARSRPNRAYIKGYWRSGPRGKSWVRGHWGRDNDRDDR